MSLTVLHTESSLGWGGQENRTLNEMLGLRELGHTALVACQPGARLGQRAREAGFEVFETRMRNAVDVPAILRLRRCIRDCRADVVNTHSGRDTQLAGMAARLLARRPRIVRTRHLALPITSRFTYSVLPDHVVTVSAHVARYLATAGVPADRITAVPTGIDLTRYIAAPGGGTLRAELGLAADAMLVGTVAILRKKKGHAELLEAIPAVLARFPDTHFVFAGDGPQRDNLERRIAELGLGNSVHLLGLRRDVVNVLQSLDLFVLPTHQEALGTAFVEAGAMGLAAIGSDIDGVPEIVGAGETGKLVPVNNPPALAAAIVELLDDPALRRHMGESARQKVAARFSRAAMVDAMVGAYRRLLEAA
ncbi:MAG: glycosyltransferase family 4 protein [Gammaproteobacteria bacterium]|nr:glycosyltransferase family 4 protein [Gammaproteobacteria bacterium]MBU1647677.1 glycosyltransferase family 4 protein [Gammaproteobacteria bacterium]MBU1971823.1 glycosyltransferase family 4 protein [Gammaproteobacteria bacterium]